MTRAVTSFFFRCYRGVASPAIQVAFGVQCRYDESCSRYMERMIKEHGLVSGIARGLRRIGSCNQWSDHG